jgi:hypothetical protein
MSNYDGLDQSVEYDAIGTLAVFSYVDFKVASA